VQIPLASGSPAVRSANVRNIYALGIPADGSEIWGPSMGFNQSGGTEIATFAITNPFGGWPLNPDVVTSTPPFNAPRGIAFGIIASAPDAPAAPTASPGDGQATISWSPPQSDGGSPVTGYTVSASPGGGTCTAARARTRSDNSRVVTGAKAQVIELGVGACSNFVGCSNEALGPARVC
jgi:hypothetical protein